jgi:exopolyphosphatase/guanosine-5'-triphosphate,3'-diphosphate pyrophosphatase
MEQQHAASAPAAAKQPEPEGGMNPVRVCVIDLGTNSFHTVIVDAYPNGTFTTLDKLKEMVHLGEHGFSHHLLTEEAAQRALQALRRIRLLAEGWHVEEYLAFATSAIREAENGGDFIQYVRDEVGIHIRPISGELEAHLIYQGVRRAVDLAEPALMVDIGGGSTEFIVATAAEVFLETSVKAGAARMTEQFISTDPVAAEELARLKAHYRTMLEPVYEAAREHGVREVVGSSGTMENLAQVCLNRFGDGGRSIFQQAFDAAAFREVATALINTERAEREAMDGIDQKRVDQIVAGAVLVEVLLEDLDLARVRLSPNALREGMVVHFIEENYERLQQLAPVGDVRRRGVYELAFRFAWDEAHSRHVAALALQLFDACQPLHGLGDWERELLEYAALLHDIGYHISRRKHHKHTLYLIMQADWHGFQPEEVAILANVARYHRRSMPKKKHEDYTSLSKDHQRLVDQLASFLRLAEGLDRSHYQNVAQLHAELDDEHLRLIIQTKGDPQMELWGARHAADLFEHTYDRRVLVSAAWMRRT